MDFCNGQEKMACFRLFLHGLNMMYLLNRDAVVNEKVLCKSNLSLLVTGVVIRCGSGEGCPQEQTAGGDR